MDDYTNREAIVPRPGSSRGLCGDAMERSKRDFRTAFPLSRTPVHVYTRYEASLDGAWKTTAVAAAPPPSAAAAEKSKEEAKKASLSFKRVKH